MNRLAMIKLFQHVFRLPKDGINQILSEMMKLEARSTGAL